MSNNEVRVNHARLTNLTPDTDYVYAAVHDGADPELGRYDRALRPETTALHQFRRPVHPALGRLANGEYVSDNIGSPAAGDITVAIERSPHCSI